MTSLLPLISGATAGGAMAGSGLFSGADAANAIDSNGDIVGAADVGGVQKAFDLPAGGSGVVLTDAQSKFAIRVWHGRQR